MTTNSSLLQWLATFELEGETQIELKDDTYYNLADGFVCARILNQICPRYFSNEWLQGIKPVQPNGSWRLRVSNLKRILHKIHDYASDLQSQQFSTSAITPDVVVIAQNFDPDQISKLIQLILFCAINCDKKEHYIEKIHDLPTQAKHNIKTAIEELLVRNDDSYSNQRPSASQIGNESSQSETGLGLNLSYKSNSSSLHNVTRSPARSTPQRGALGRDSSQLSTDSNQDTSQLSRNYTIEEVRQKLSDALILKDERAQACHELELKLKQVQIERDQLAFENERLSKAKQPATPTKTSELSRFSALSRDDVSGKERRERVSPKIDDQASDIVLAQTRKLQNEVHRLKDELIKMETEKEDYRLRSNLLQDDLDKLTSKHEELRNKAELVKKLQDELDEHKQVSEKVINYETKMENLLKKNTDLKREFKNLEEKNLVNVKTIVRLEEEKSQLSNTVSRIEVYKKQLQEAQIKLSKETHRADKAELELSRITERYSVTKRENERLFETTNQLMRSNHGALMLGSQGSLPSENSGQQAKELHNITLNEEGENRTVVDDDNLGSMPVMELKEMIARLQVENELLLKRIESKKENDETVLSGLLDSANTRCWKLEAENRQVKKKVILLESHLKDLNNLHGGPSTSTAIPSDSSSDNMLALINRVEELQRLLFQREQELIESETKYRKNLQKAKEVFKSINSNQSLSGSLHPSCLSSASSFNSNSLDETNMLRQQLKDREDRLIELEREFTGFKRIKELHERLILTAFYGLTTPIQRRNVDRRLDRTTLTSPSNTASSSIHSKHS